jgi:peptidoglycan/LPS O-acetylase OafA/YrhL
MGHYNFFFHVGIEPPAGVNNDAKVPFFNFIGPLYHQADTAVLLFWAISGFIFFWKYAEPIHNRAISGPRFFAWRFSRLYPLHVLTLFAVIVLQTVYCRMHGDHFYFALGSPSELGLQLTMASRWFNESAVNFNGPIWTVSVEVLVYALFFFVAARWRLNGNVALAASIAAYAGMATPLDGFVHYPLLCSALFFAGGYAYSVVSRLTPMASRIVFWAALATAATVFYVFLTQDGTPRPKLAFAVAAVFVFALMDKALPFNLTRLAKLGDLTFGSYLWQFPLQIVFVLIADACGFGRDVFCSPVPMAAWLGTTFLFAAVSHRLIEIPAQRAIRNTYVRVAWPAAAAVDGRPCRL